jgi:hypothetical protein
MSEKLEKFRDLNNQIAAEYAKRSHEMSGYFKKIADEMNEETEIDDQDIRLAEFELKLLNNSESLTTKSE